MIEAITVRELAMIISEGQDWLAYDEDANALFDDVVPRDNE